MNGSRLRGGLVVAFVAMVSLLAVVMVRRVSNQLTLTNEYELSVDE
ncbi:MAG: hypothetical protein ACKO83_01740 [Roseiflexaceae bacterium]